MMMMSKDNKRAVVWPEACSMFRPSMLDMKNVGLVWYIHRTAWFESDVKVKLFYKIRPFSRLALDFSDVRS